MLANLQNARQEHQDEVEGHSNNKIVANFVVVSDKTAHSNDNVKGPLEERPAQPK